MPANRQARRARGSCGRTAGGCVVCPLRPARMAPNQDDIATIEEPQLPAPRPENALRPAAWP